MTQDDKIKALLNLLDDVIKKDEERAPGEWRAKVRAQFPDQEVSIKPYLLIRSVVASENYDSWTDASFIASASVSHGKNARALKSTVEFLIKWRDAYRKTGPGIDFPGKFPQDKQLDSILSLYPDEILKRYL